MNLKLTTPALALGVLSIYSTYSFSSGREPRRPHILRIAQVTLLTTDVPATRAFLGKLLPNGHISCDHCARVPENAFLVNSEQSIYLSRAPSPTPTNLLGSVTFATNDVHELRRYLEANNITCSPPSSEKGADKILGVRDPEGRTVVFIYEPKGAPERSVPESQRRLEIIHAGFIVRDRAATEHFYKDILGFRPYWHGGMKEDQTDWVSMQVPDGTDWLEFMVNVDANPDQRLRGIMNHIAIGVTDIHETEKRLRAAGAQVNEEPKIGRDGKWQLNVYDPDLTRVEFMEFKPVQKPCCSDFTGPHPQP